MDARTAARRRMTVRKFASHAEADAADTASSPDIPEAERTHARRTAKDLGDIEGFEYGGTLVLAAATCM